MRKTQLSKEEEITIRSYNAGADSWATAYSTPGYWRNELKEFHELLPSGKVLEVGCGGGRDAEDLLNMGYKYTGTDAAKKFVDICKRRFPAEERLLVRNLYNLKFPGNSFDGFWASAVFLHIPKRRAPEALVNLRNVVRPGGIGFISVKEGEGEKIIEDVSEGDGKKYKRFWAFYRFGEFARELVESGFDIKSGKTRVQSARTTWLTYFVEKPDRANT